MAKKKKKKKRLWAMDVSYTRIDKEADKKRQKINKQISGALKKREKQLDKIIKLLRRIAKK